jgi:hypothetical protein
MNHCMNILEVTNSEFLAVMRKQAIKIARRRKGRSLTIDDLRHFALASGVTPRSTHAWGAIFKGREWEAVNFETSRFPSNRQRAVRRWRLV